MDLLKGMNELSIDIETYSDVDLKKSGMYKYTESPAFEIILFSFAWDRGPVTCIDLLSGEQVPVEVLDALIDDGVLKTAFNAQFERTCIAKHYGLILQPEQWQCTMMKASMLGLPLALETVARVLRITDQKDAGGKALIRYFSVPCKATKANGHRTRNLPEHAPDKWQEYKSYNIQDVKTEVGVLNKIEFYKIPAIEMQVWYLDQKINDTGILLDRQFINAVLRIDAENRALLLKEAVDITGLQNPNSRAQLITWLSEEMPLDIVHKLRKEDIPILREAADGYINKAIIERILDIRAELSQTSIKKYKAMINFMGADDCIRGMHQYYGAGTGRWAGRGVQPHNLKKNEMKQLDAARQITRMGSLEWLEMIFDNVSDTLSQLIRTAFIAAKNNNFMMADFSAIEARVIAWLAGEGWRLEVFATHGRIYEASAASMFNVPLESISYVDATGKIVKGDNYHLRAKGKIAELALGFQGAKGALMKMDKDKVLVESEIPGIVKAWRTANPKIVRLWYGVEEAAVAAVATPGKITVFKNIKFQVRYNILWVSLPSGRYICYIRPRLKPGRYEKMIIAFEGTDSETKKWCVQDTYGGKLVENIVQGIARDCLATAMLRLDEANFKIVMHVHDEAVADEPDLSRKDEMQKIMAMPMPWAPDLPLTAEVEISPYYKK